MPIVDGRVLDATLHQAVTDPRTYLLRFYPDAPVPTLDAVDWDVNPLPAEVRHGVWVARCPCPASGEPGEPLAGGVVWLDMPLVWCPRCGNEEAGGLWRRAIVPAQREAIERVLLARPNPANRNWIPRESVGDLIRQNKQHGCPAEVR